MKNTENCEITELNIQISKLLEFEKKCRRKLDRCSLMLKDQRAANDQRWRKISRIERFLKGEDYKEE